MYDIWLRHEFISREKYCQFSTHNQDISEIIREFIDGLIL